MISRLALLMLIIISIMHNLVAESSNVIFILIGVISKIMEEISARYSVART